MLRRDDLVEGSRALLDAAMLGCGWEEALRQLSTAAAARGVALIRNKDRRLIAALTNQDIAQPIADYLAGKAPPNSRQVRVHHARRTGFRVDFDDYSQEQLDRDPFYQDFLRPIGAFWHANAQLEYEPGDELAVSFKRDLDRGPYSIEEAELLNLILPDIKTAMRIAQSVIGARAAGVALALHHRGDPVFELDGLGYVLRVHGTDDLDRLPVRVRRRRLSTRDRRDQVRWDEVIATVLRTQAPAQLVFRSDEGSYQAEILPVTGMGADVFRSAAIVVKIAGRAREQRSLASEVAGAFSFTEREAGIARLLVEGRSLSEISALMKVKPETVRFHLKGLFRKTNTNRQGELIALLSRLSS